MKKHSSWTVWGFRVGLLAFVMALVSCSTVGKWVYSEPKAEIQTLEIKHLSLSKLELGVAVQLENSNSFALEVSGLDYQLVAFTDVIGEGRIEKPVKIGAKSRSIVDLPIKIAPEKVIKLAGRLLLHRLPAELELKGKMTIKTFIGSFDVDVSERKKINPPNKAKL